MAEKNPTAPAEPKSLGLLKQSMQYFVSKEVEALLEKHALAVVAEYNGKPADFSQAANALALVLAIREVDPQFGPKDKGGRYTNEQWAKILGLLYKGGNASALRQAIADSGKGTTSIAAAYAAGTF